MPARRTTRATAVLAALALASLTLTGCGPKGPQSVDGTASGNPRAQVAAAFDALDDGPVLVATVSADISPKVWEHWASEAPSVPASAWEFGQSASIRVVAASADGKALQGQWGTAGAVESRVDVDNGADHVMSVVGADKAVYLSVNVDQLSAISGQDLRPTLESSAADPTYGPLLRALLDGKAVSLKQSTLTALAKQAGSRSQAPDPKAAQKLYAELVPAIEQSTDVTQVSAGTYQVSVNVRDAAHALLDAARETLPAATRADLPTPAQLNRTVPADKTLTATVTVADGVASSVTFDLNQLASLTDRAKLAVTGDRMVLRVDFDTDADAPQAPADAVPADQLLATLTQTLGGFGGM